VFICFPSPYDDSALSLSDFGIYRIASSFLPFFVKTKKATDTFHGLIITIKKPWGLIRLTHGFHSIALGSEAWVNPPKAKKEKVFVESGHHSLVYSFYYFICHNVKSRIGKNCSFA
jgi:hypothetical protein